MIKLVGMIAVIACGGAFGMKRSSELRERLRQLRLLEQSLFDIGIALEYNAATTAEILRMLRKSGKLEFFGDLDHNRLKESLLSSEGFCSLMIADEEKEIVTDVFSQLGGSDLATQLSMIGFNKKRIRMAIEACERECASKCRLYNSLGFLGGIFVSLLII